MQLYLNLDSKSILLWPNDNVGTQSMLCLSQLCALTPELKCLLQTNPLFKLGSISSLLIAPKVFFFFNLSGNRRTITRFCLPVIRHCCYYWGYFWWRWLYCCGFFLYDSLLFLLDIFLPKNKDLWLYFYIGFWRTIYLIPQTYVRKSNFSRQIFTFDK